jgi:subtilisin family serine protease
MDGNSTPVTRAADMAAGCGILVVNSAGNEGGSSWHFIGAPADGDSVFSIGAVDGSGFYAGFSSVGPTYDGRMKPDVVAQGSGTTVVAGWGGVVQGSGTSFSSPVTAGALACLCQSAPSYTADQIRTIVRNTASQATNPDYQYGYGIPNMLNAFTMTGVPDSKSRLAEGYTLYPNPFQNDAMLQKTQGVSETSLIEILSITGAVIDSKSTELQGGAAVQLEALNGMTPGIYFIRITTEKSQQVLRAVKI